MDCDLLYFETLSAMNSAGEENALDSSFSVPTHDWALDVPKKSSNPFASPLISILEDWASGDTLLESFRPDQESLLAETSSLLARPGKKRPKLYSACSALQTNKKMKTKKRKGVAGRKENKTIAMDYVQKTKTKQQKVVENDGKFIYSVEALESGTLAASPMIDEVVYSPNMDVFSEEYLASSSFGDSIFSCEQGVGAPDLYSWKFAHDVHNDLYNSPAREDLRDTFALVGCMSISPEVEDRKSKVSTKVEDVTCTSPIPDVSQEMGIIWPRNIEAPSRKTPEPMEIGTIDVKEEFPPSLDGDEHWPDWELESAEPDSVDSLSSLSSDEVTRYKPEVKCETRKRKRSHQPRRKRRRRSERKRKNNLGWWNQYTTSMQNELIQAVDDCVNEQSAKYADEDELSQVVRNEIRARYELSEQQADDLQKIYLERKTENVSTDPRKKRGQDPDQFENGPDFYICVKTTALHRIGETVRFRSVTPSDDLEEHWEGLLWDGEGTVVVKSTDMQHGEKVEIVNYQRLKVDSKHWKSVNDVVVTESADLESHVLFTLPVGKTVKFGDASCDGMLDRRQIGGYLDVNSVAFVNRGGDSFWVCKEDTPVHDKLDTKKAKLLFTIPKGTPVTFADENETSQRRRVVCGWVTVADVENDRLNFVYQDIHATALVPHSVRLDCPKYELPDELEMLVEAMKRSEKKRWFFVDDQAFLLKDLAADHSKIIGEYYHPHGNTEVTMKLPTGKPWVPLRKHLTHRRRAQQDVKCHINMTQSSKTVKSKKFVIPLTHESIEAIFNEKLQVIEDIRSETEYQGDHIVLDKARDSLLHCKYLALQNQFSDGHFDLSNRLDIQPTLTPADVLENMNWLLHTAELIEKIQSRCGEVARLWKQGLIREWKKRETLERRKSSKIGVGGSKRATNAKKGRRKGKKRSNKQ